MFDHVGIGVSERAFAEPAYAAVLAVLGHEMEHNSMGPQWDDFCLTQADDQHPVTTGLHIGFVAASRDHVDAFWRSGLEVGLRDDGKPGPRPEYSDSYYGAFLLDPDGNSIEAVHRDGLRRDGIIDHLWLRVAALETSAAFYEAVASHAGYAPGARRPGRVLFGGENGSFSVLEGAPTRNVHIAFEAPDNADVAAFHRSLTALGHPDNGEPGMRPRYHDGYYGAFVLDPDGNNVEVVCHNRYSERSSGSGSRA